MNVFKKSPFRKLQAIEMNASSEATAPSESRLQSQEERIASLEAELAEIKALLKSN